MLLLAVSNTKIGMMHARLYVMCQAYVKMYVKS